MSKSRISELDYAKGIGIFLVGLGHIIAREGPQGNDWAITMKMLVYTFHMPFFMFLSGFLMYYSYRKVDTIRDYGNYAMKKFIRLFPAFLIFSLLVFFGKYYSDRFMHVDNSVTQFSEYFQIYLTPQNSYSNYLWYIYVLFEFYLIFPILFFISKQKLLIWLPVSLLLSVSVYFIDIYPWFALNMIFQFFFVFTLGVVCAKYYQYFLKYIKKYSMLYLILFIAALFSRIYYPIPKIVMGLLSIPALFALITFPWFRFFSHIELWGKYTFIIFLLNTMTIGILKGIMLSFISWDYYNFLIVAPVLLFGGLYIPILVKKYILKYIPYLDKITS